MRYPNFKEEKKLWKKGYKFVVGLDEAGRGPLAGPVVAGAILLNENKNLEKLKLRDSKKLSQKKREEFYKILTNHPQIEWAVGRVSEKVIDKINILEATKLAMERAIENMGRKTERAKKKVKIQKLEFKPDFLIIDGNFKIDSPISQKPIIKADEKVFFCAAASIIAKVSRDRIMRRCHKKYSQYGFNKHKGYGTKLHFKMLKKYGPCEIHRKSFKPVKLLKT